MSFVSVEMKVWNTISFLLASSLLKITHKRVVTLLVKTDILVIKWLNFSVSVKIYYQLVVCSLHSFASLELETHYITTKVIEINDLVTTAVAPHLTDPQELLSNIISFVRSLKADVINFAVETVNEMFHSMFRIWTLV